MPHTFQVARAQVQAREAFRRRAYEADYAKGLIEDHVPFRPMSDEAMDAEARRQVKARADWKASPQGRFFAIAVAIGEMGLFDESEELRAIYGRSMSDGGTPSDADARRARRVLDSISHPPATEAVRQAHNLLAVMVGGQAKAA
ncbi:hypothetical protein ACO2Q0_02825 [Phenylobacterium sp. VNQ135]|uniref:hypothetical protein n=1 Tax=Phenylobacterium sp. VNQ135 TaxID=3400922 RepID=UPI003BFC3D8C